MPNQKKGILENYLYDKRAKKYVEMDNAANGWILPEKTVLNENFAGIGTCSAKKSVDTAALDRLASLTEP